MNIQLRERTEAHVRTYFAATRDPEIQSMLHQAAQTVEQAVADFYKTQLPGATSFGRTIYADDAYVGDIWCYCIDPAEEPNAMVSYCIFEKNLWGKGIATEALRQFLAEITPRFALKTVGAFAWTANAASRKVMEKNGFLPVETFVEEGMEAVYCQKNMEEAQ